MDVQVAEEGLPPVRLPDGVVGRLRRRGTEPAFPLDDKLRLVVLTGEERARIEAARWSGPAAA